MKSFKLGNNSITFSDSFDSLNTFRNALVNSTIKKEAVDAFHEAIKDKDRKDIAITIVQDASEKINQCIINNAVPKAIDFLIDHDIFDCDEAIFVDKYQNDLFDYTEQPGFQSFASKLETVVDDYEKHKEYKDNKRANRSQWVGGGFGVSGAIKGAVQAKAMNVATDAVRGIGWAFNDFADNNYFNKMKANLITDDIWTDLEGAIDSCILGVYIACLIEYGEHTGEKFDWISEENNNKAKAILNNIKTRKLDPERILKLLAGAIQIYPYNAEYFYYLYGNTDCSRTEINDIASYLGLSLDAFRLKRAINDISEAQEWFNRQLDEVDDDEDDDEDDDDDDDDLETIDYKNTKRYRYALLREELAEKILQIGLKYGLINSDNPLEIYEGSVKTNTKNVEMIKIVMTELLEAYDEEAQTIISLGVYSDAEHQEMLIKLENFCERFDVNRLGISYDDTASEILEKYKSGKDLEDAAISRQEEILLDRIIELEDIAEDESLAPINKMAAISGFAKKYDIKFQSGHSTSDAQNSLAIALCVTLAREEVRKKYKEKIINQILHPSMEAFDIEKQVRSKFVKYGLLKNIDDETLREDVSPDAMFLYHEPYYYDAYDDCNDYFTILAEIRRFIGSYRKPKDSARREKIGEIIIKYCQAYSSDEKLFINSNRDRFFGLHGELDLRDYSHCLPSEDTIYAYYLNGKTFLVDLDCVLFTDSGVVITSILDNDIFGVLVKWSECIEASSAIMGSTYIVKRFDKNNAYFKIMKGGARLINAIINEVNGLKEEENYDSRIEEPENVGEKTFLGVRLNYYLDDKLKEKAMLRGHTDYDDVGDLDIIAKNCSFVTDREADPKLNFFMSLGEEQITSIDDIENVQKSFLLLTNNYLYFPVSGVMRAVPVGFISGIQPVIERQYAGSGLERISGQLIIREGNKIHRVIVKCLSESDLIILADGLDNALAINIDFRKTN